MQYYDLTDEEQKLLNSVESESFSPKSNWKKKEKTFQEAAKKQLNKTKVITIRLSEADVMGMKSKAAEEGMPYQTLISSVLHKFVQKDRRKKEYV